MDQRAFLPQRLEADAETVGDLPCAREQPVVFDGFHRRQRDAARDRIENEAMAFHERVRAGYREMAAREPDRFRVIDASAGVDPVFDQVRAATMALFRARGWTGPHRSEERRS